MKLNWKSKVRNFTTTEQCCSVLVGRASVQTYNVPMRAAQSLERQCDGVHHKHLEPRRPAFSAGSQVHNVGDLRHLNALCNYFLLLSEVRKPYPLNVCELHELIMLGSASLHEHWYVLLTFSLSLSLSLSLSHTRTHHTHIHTKMASILLLFSVE
jgi:hypothetical protein